jgi:protein-tyrosine-phosphatase
MDEPETVIPVSVRKALHSAARDLHHRFEGVFGEETTETLLLDSYSELGKSASGSRWLVLSAERFAKQRLEALVHAESKAEGRPPGALFLCVNNAGRSQMALGFFRHRAGDRAYSWSGGSEPGSEVNPAAVAAMAELGIDITGEFPKPWTEEFLSAADVVVTMGCGDSCPLVPGKHYEDWELQDPAGLSLDEIRPIRDEIAAHVDRLLERLGIITSGAEPPSPTPQAAPTSPRRRRMFILSRRSASAAARPRLPS